MIRLLLVLALMLGGCTAHQPKYKVEITYPEGNQHTFVVTWFHHYSDGEWRFKDLNDRTISYTGLAHVLILPVEE